MSLQSKIGKSLAQNITNFDCLFNSLNNLYQEKGSNRLIFANMQQLLDEFIDFTSQPKKKKKVNEENETNQSLLALTITNTSLSSSSSSSTSSKTLSRSHQSQSKKFCIR